MTPKTISCLMLELLIHATPAGAVDHVVIIHGVLLVRAVVVRLIHPRRHCGIVVSIAMIRSGAYTAATTSASSLWHHDHAMSMLVPICQIMAVMI